MKLLCCRALYEMPVSTEPTRFDHSIKNIPLPSAKDYNRALIEKTELLCKRMRWKAFFFLNPNVGINKKETFGFTSKKTPPQISEMLNFEKRLLQMIANIRVMIVTSSSKRRPLSFTATVNYGPRKRHLTYLTSPWVVMTAPSRANLDFASQLPKSQLLLSAKIFLRYPE